MALDLAKQSAFLEEQFWFQAHHQPAHVAVTITVTTVSTLHGELVLQVRQQTLYILQVLPSGRFVKVQSLGTQCNDDDQLFLELHEERERQWQALQSQVAASCHNCGLTHNRLMSQLRLNSQPLNVTTAA